MKQHQILYSKQMILAKLAGHKTVTRRPIKNAPDVILDVQKRNALGFHEAGEEIKMLEEIYEIKCPYGTTGDWLWTKENFKVEYGITLHHTNQLAVKYKADQQLLKPILTDKEYEKWQKWKQPIGSKSKLFMFRSLSRFLDEVTEVSVERVQDITGKEAWNEGLRLDSGTGRNIDPDASYAGDKMYVKQFEKLWQSMYQGGEFDWKHNPYVWVVRYKPLAVNQAENQNFELEADHV